MACSKYEYVKEYEVVDTLLKSTFIVVRVDGRGFTKFCEVEKFEKPNDDAGLWLMTRAALEVMDSFADIVFAFGQSDEFSFVFRLLTTLYNRRLQKILSTVVSAFTAAYTRLWLIVKAGPSRVIPTDAQGPAFDGRVVLYATLPLVKDYLSWRQVDCHINNLYNYCFWLTVKRELKAIGEPCSKKDIEKVHKRVQERISNTNSALKNELLFKEFNINYNDVPQLHRKGTLIYRAPTGPLESCAAELSATPPQEKAPKFPDPQTKTLSMEDFTVTDFAANEPVCLNSRFYVTHENLIQKIFWLDRQYLEKLLLS